MATIETVPDVELIEHLDFDSSPKCEVDHCDRTAAWVARTTCCGFRVLECDEHKRAFDEQIKDFFAQLFVRVQGLACRGCDRVHRDFDWVEWIPIEGRS